MYVRAAYQGDDDGGAPPATWAVHLLRRLSRRQARVRHIASLVLSQNEWSHRCARLEVECSHLRRDVSQRDGRIAELQHALESRPFDSSTVVSNGASASRIRELEEKLAQLREDSSEAIRQTMQERKATNVAREELEIVRGELERHVTRIEYLTTEVEELTRSKKELTESYREALEKIETFEVEHAAAMRTIQELSDSLSSARTDYDQVISVLMREKEKQAELMNEIAEMNNKLFHHHEAEMNAARYGTSIASSSKTSDDFVSIVDSIVLPTKSYRDLDGHTDFVNSCCFSSSGFRFVSGSSDKTLRVWDGETFLPQNILHGSLSAIMQVAVSPNGEFVCAASNDKAARVWSVSQGRLRHTLTGHGDTIYGAAFTGDSSFLITGSHDRSLRKWDVNRGACLHTSMCTSSFLDLCCLSSQEMIISGHFDGKLRLWDTRSCDLAGEVMGIHSSRVTGVALFPDETRVLTYSRDNTLNIVDLRTRSSLFTLSNSELSNGLDWSHPTVSPDGKYIAAGTSTGNIMFFDAVKGKYIKSISGISSKPVSSLSWSPTGDWLVLAGNQPNMCLYKCSVED